jgi:5'-phosphate synthase pdxT subunit
MSAQPTTSVPHVVGVLALQGAFAAHAEVLASLGATTREVRTPDDLEGVAALVLPGGESTTMSKLLESSGLFDPIAKRMADGMPVFGTCAGLILLSSEVLDGRPGQRLFAAIDLVSRRNGYGRQIDSFEETVAVAGLDGPEFPVVFIRAPIIESVGAGVEVLASVDGRPVLCRQGHVLVAAFHPELTGDARIHQLFLNDIDTQGV